MAGIHIHNAPDETLCSSGIHVVVPKVELAPPRPSTVSKLDADFAGRNQRLVIAGIPNARRFPDTTGVFV
jgi:hypothetical protein